MEHSNINKSYIISYEYLWKAIIRPPRMTYEESDLGKRVFTFRKKTYHRKDYQLLGNQGYILKCSFVQPIEADRPSLYMPVVIYLHGNSSSRLEGLKMFNLLAYFNINLFTFDFAGCGKSEGEYISLGYHEQEDLRVIVDFVEKLHGVSKIGLWGRSMGAATTMLYAYSDKRIKAICLDSPFADFRRLAKEMCANVINLPDFLVETALNIINATVKKKNGLDIKKLRPIDFAAKTEIPAIFIHAKKDELISYQHSIDLSEEYGGERSLKMPEGRHNSPRPRFILDEIGSFFGKYLIPGFKDIRETTVNLFDMEEDEDDEDKDDVVSGFEDL